jgi:hypothetical protein
MLIGGAAARARNSSTEIFIKHPSILENAVVPGVYPPVNNPSSLA